MDPLPPAALAILTMVIVRAVMQWEDRQRARPQAPPQVWGEGWVRARRPGELSRVDWVLGLGSLVALAVVIGFGVVALIAR